MKQMRASYAAQADYAKNAYQATLASMALESQRLNQAGDMIMINPTNHYVVFVGANQDPASSIFFDLINRKVYNLTVVPPEEKTDASTERLALMEQRLKNLESFMANK
jgi:hypothetical protein